MSIQLPSIRFIREHLENNQYRLTKHATTARLQRGITITELKRALLNGEIIEKYPNDQPYPSCLVLGWLVSGDPLHVVCSRGNIDPAMRIVTVYEPSDNKWENDYKTRRKVKK